MPSSAAFPPTIDTSRVSKHEPLHPEGPSQVLQMGLVGLERACVCVCVCVSVCLFVCVCIYLLPSRKWMKPCGSPTLLLIHPSRPPDDANACGALCWLHCPLPVVPLGCAVLMLTFVLQPLAHGLGQPGAPLPWQHPLLIVALYK